MFVGSSSFLILEEKWEGELLTFLDLGFLVSLELGEGGIEEEVEEKCGY